MSVLCTAVSKFLGDFFLILSSGSGAQQLTLMYDCDMYYRSFRICTSHVISWCFQWLPGFESISGIRSVLEVRRKESVISALLNPIYSFLYFSTTLCHTSFFWKIIQLTTILVVFYLRTVSFVTIFCILILTPIFKNDLVTITNPKSVKSVQTLFYHKSCFFFYSTLMLNEFMVRIWRNFFHLKMLVSVISHFWPLRKIWNSKDM